MSGGIESARSRSGTNTFSLCRRIPVQVEGDFTFATLHLVEDQIEFRFHRHPFAVARPIMKASAPNVSTSPMDLIVYQPRKYPGAV